jgi:hypothetical protein
MFALSPFIYIPAIVLLIGIFFNTRALYRKCSATRFADKAQSVAVVFAVLSVSMPMLLFVGVPSIFKQIVGAFCLVNFAVALVHIVRWFGGARRAEQDAQKKKGN